MPAARRVFFFLTCLPAVWTSDKVPPRVVPSTLFSSLLPDTTGGGLLRSVDSVTVCRSKSGVVGCGGEEEAYHSALVEIYAFGRSIDLR